MSSFTQQSPEAVLEHLDWVKRLAQRLCADACLADDVAQETFLAAMRQAPPDGTSLRRWLAGIVRNRTRHALRSERRRRDHEWLATAAGDEPAVADVVERVATQRLIVDRVMALAEPYRSTLLLRYFEDKSAAKIARSTGVPIATVKTRLRRGLAQLRADMDSEFGSDGRSWMIALFPLLPKSGAQGAITTGVLAMGVKPLLVGLPILFAVVAAAVYFSGLDAGIATLEPLAGAEQVVGLLPTPESREQRVVVLDGLERPGRTAVNVPDMAEASAVEVAQAPTIKVHVLVFDLQSRPVAGVEVKFSRALAARDGTIAEAGLALGVTDNKGLLETDMPANPGFLYVNSASYQTLVEGAVSANGRLAKATIVVAPPCAIDGLVVDESGQAIAGATVTYASGANLFADLDISMDRVSGASWVTKTDAGGGFHFERVPQLPAGFLRASTNGYLTRAESLPGPGDHDIEIVMTRLSPDADVLLGQVFDEYGSAVEAAYVAFGQMAVRTDAQGVFQMDVVGMPDSPTVRAVKAGYLPASFTLNDGEDWPFPLHLVLGANPLAIEGRVLDEDRQPLEGIRVSLFDATEFGWISKGAAGESGLMGASVEGILADQGGGVSTKTDELGRYRIQGLLPRDYRLQVSDPGTLQVKVSAPIAAGARHVEIVLPGVGESVDIVGRVTDSEGQPLESVNVMLSREVDAGAKGTDEGFTLNGPSVQTDEEGRFEFNGLRASGLRLFFYPSKQYVAQRRKLSDFEDPGGIEVALLRNAELRVSLGGDQHMANAFELRGPEGDPVLMRLSEGTGSFWVKEGWFSDGRSGLYMVSEGEFVVVLLKDGEEVARAEVNLRGGEIRKVDF